MLFTGRLMYILSVGVVAVRHRVGDFEMSAFKAEIFNVSCYGFVIHARREYYAYVITDNSIFGEDSNGGITLWPGRDMER